MKSVFLKLFKNGRSYSLAVKTTFFTHYLSNLNQEEEGSSFKIDDFLAHCSLNLKGAWQAKLLSDTLLTLQKNTTFIGVQIMLLSFLDISASFRFLKKVGSRESR